MSIPFTPFLRLLGFAALIFVATSSAFAEAWTVIPSGITSKLYGVTFVTPKVGYAVGSNGTLLKTTDRAATWRQERFATGYNRSLYCISMQDTDSFAMTVGDNGQMMELFRDSPKWTALIPVADTLYGICSRVDSVSTFVTVGTNGYIAQMQWHTHTYTLYDDQTGEPYDTTEIWQDTKLLSITSGATLRAVAFTPANRGFVVGDSGIILTSTNYGVTWSRKGIGETVSLRALALISTNRIMTVGSAGNMWLTTNNGTTWASVTPPGLTTNLHAISFIDAQRGVVVGDDGLILQTSDAGATWYRVGSNTFTTLLGVSCIQSEGLTNWVAVGENGTMVQSLYGGIPAAYASDKSSISFGNVNLGSKKSDNVAYTNTRGDGYATVRVVSPDPHFTITPDRVVVDLTGPQTIKYTFTPTDTGTVTAKVRVYTDTSWFVDTLLLTGRGVAPFSELTRDHVEFDSGLAGMGGSLFIRNTGNAQLTAHVLSVSDTNFTVTCGLNAEPGDSLEVFTLLKHTLLTDITARAVIQTNSYRHPLDTIQLVGHAAPQTAVRENIAPKTVDALLFPNPLSIKAGEILHVAGIIPNGSTARIFDERGCEVFSLGTAKVAGSHDAEWSLPALAAGRYFLDIAGTNGIHMKGKLIIH